MHRGNAMDWFPMWNETLNKRKVQALPGDLFKSWCNLMMLASSFDADGELPPIPEIAFALRVTDEQAIEMTEKLIALNFIDRLKSKLRIHNWDHWQLKSYSSAKRTAEWRERKRDSQVTDSDVTPSSQVTEHETSPVTGSDGTPACALRLEEIREEKKREETPLPPSGGMSPNGDSANFVLPTGSRKKAKAGDVPFKIPDWISVDDWLDFEAMRKKIRKPLTDRARRAIVKELLKLQGEGHAPPAVLEQSIRNCWQDVFPIRQSNNGKNGAPPPKRNQNLAEYEASQARIAAGKARTEELNRLTREARGE